MKNTIITEEVMIHYENIDRIFRYDNCTVITTKNGREMSIDKITKEQEENFNNWLKNKDKQLEELEEQVKEKFKSNLIKEMIGTIHYEDAEQSILVIDFIKHMVDTYEVSIRISREFTETPHILITDESSGIRITYGTPLTNDYEFEYTERAKELMNNEDGYFKER